MFFYTITYEHTYRRAGETTRAHYVPSPLPQQRPPRSSVVILLFSPLRSMFLTAKCVVLETIEFVCSAEEGRMSMKKYENRSIKYTIILLTALSCHWETNCRLIGQMVRTAEMSARLTLPQVPCSMPTTRARQKQRALHICGLIPYIFWYNDHNRKWIVNQRKWAT